MSKLLLKNSSQSATLQPTRRDSELRTFKTPILEDLGNEKAV